MNTDARAAVMEGHRRVKKATLMVMCMDDDNFLRLKTCSLYRNRVLL
jgi:hypothetical protein